MFKNKNNNVLDLSNKNIKRLFSDYLNEKVLSNNISKKTLAEKTEFEYRTIQRYLAGNLPKNAIPPDTYTKLLHAVGATHEEFRNFAGVNQQSTGSFSEIFHSLQRPFSPWLLWGLPFILLILFLTWVSLEPPLKSEEYYDLGVIAMNQKKDSKAIDLFIKAIEKNNTNVDAYYGLADVYAEMAGIEKAIEYYYRGIEIDGNLHPRAYNNLALLLLSQGDVGNTLVLLDKAEGKITTSIAEEQWAQSGIILKNRAWAFWKNGVYAEAMDYIVEAQKKLGAAQMLGEFPEVFCLHALIARHTGDKTDRAEQECITRIKANQTNQRDGGTNKRVSPIGGIIYDIYQLVLKQHNK